MLKNLNAHVKINQEIKCNHIVNSDFDGLPTYICEDASIVCKMHMRADLEYDEYVAILLGHVVSMIMYKIFCHLLWFLLSF